MDPIPISTVALPEGTEELVLSVLRSGRLAQGPMVAELEELMAALCGVEHAVAVSNGTVSLVAALEALGIGPGDEVVTSPFTFVATLNAILERGARVRFADIDPDDFCVDPDAVADAIGPDTAALLPVHLYGQPARMEVLSPMAERHGLTLVEDAAQAHGARIGDRPVGSYGVGSFSFYATKNIACGEGGMVTTSDAEVADRLRLLRNQGMRARYRYEVPGHNFRMTELQAAVGIPQLRRIAETDAARSANAATLTEGLAGIDGLVTPSVRPGVHHVWHQYTIRVTDAARCTRDEVAEGLDERGIGCGVYYPGVVDDHDCYRDHPLVAAADVPVARRVATEVLSLPVHPGLGPSELERIVGGVREVLGA
ncbi:MAG: DegT/DnrJ/EryC1/StrS family aminotransferase [Acidimicrobiia bacterium]|nr:DegT/DnrJ/EryC1/StrS family aminotransferase [Acidimicrobiia bacterium]